MHNLRLDRPNHSSAVDFSASLMPVHVSPSLYNGTRNWEAGNNVGYEVAISTVRSTEMLQLIKQRC